MILFEIEKKALDGSKVFKKSQYTVVNSSYKNLRVTNSNDLLNILEEMNKAIRDCNKELLELFYSQYKKLLSVESISCPDLVSYIDHFYGNISFPTVEVKTEIKEEVVEAEPVVETPMEVVEAVTEQVAVEEPVKVTKKKAKK